MAGLCVISIRLRFYPWFLFFHFRITCNHLFQQFIHKGKQGRCISSRWGPSMLELSSRGGEGLSSTKAAAMTTTTTTVMDSFSRPTLFPYANAIYQFWLGLFQKSRHYFAVFSVGYVREQWLAFTSANSLAEIVHYMWLKQVIPLSAARPKNRFLWKNVRVRPPP